MRQIIIILALLFKLTVMMIENYRYREQVRKHFTQKQTVLQLDFKTPKLGFLPFDRKDSVIWSVYHLYIFYKRISHIHHHGRYGVNLNNFKTLNSSIISRDMDLVYKYSNYYYRNLCSEGCPIHTKCQWGFCVCNEGKSLDLVETPIL